MTLTVTQGMTTPKRAGKQPRPVWYVDGPDVEAYATALYSLGGTRWPRGSRGRFSFFEDPTDAVAQLTDADHESFAERQEGMRERAAARADRGRGGGARGRVGLARPPCRGSRQ